MTRPGSRLRTMAARLCQANTMERLVDPAITDLQLEYKDAVRRGRTWQSRWIWTRGHVAFLKMLTVHGAQRAADILFGSSGEDRRALIRTFGFGVAMVVVWTVLLTLPLITRFQRDQPDIAARLTLYVMAQTLPISIPAGLTFGILWGLGRVAASRRVRSIVLLLGLAASLASFTMLAWVIPFTNHATRVTVFNDLAQRSGAPGVKYSAMKGPRELTLRELGELLEQRTQELPPFVAGFDVHRLAFEYHARFAMACTPFALCFFALALTSRQRSGRFMLGLAGFAAVFGYYVLMEQGRLLARDPAVPVIAAAWAPNIACLLISATIASLSRLRQRVAARA